MPYITNLAANSYAGQFKSPRELDITVEGTFNTDSNKKINQFSGRASQGELRICDFSCNTYADPISFNYSNVSDPELFIDAISCIQNAYDAIVEELKEIN